MAAGAAALIATMRSTAQSQYPSPAPTDAWKRLYPGAQNERVKTSGAEINVVTMGQGAPLLMMHGAPQSLVTWYLIAAELSKNYRLIMTDHRGYGDSSKPADQPNHASQSKSNMALDGVEVMKHYGYDRFAVVGHDRGGRVGRRMALDHPDKVTKLTVIDIVPSNYLYAHVTIDFVQAYFHWFNYLRAAPGPELELLNTNMTQAAPFSNGKGKGKGGAKGGGGGTDDLAALVASEYQRHNTDINMLHGMCEDYRASASIDLDQDNADQKAGKKIQCPVNVLWAAPPGGAMGRLYDVLDIWKGEGVNVIGKALPGGHSLQETTPKETTDEILNFMKG
jgi:haloacetate dehalogenase